MDTAGSYTDRFGQTPIPARVAARAATKYVVDPESGCHISTYWINSSGYGIIKWASDYKQYATSAHRAAYVHHSGEQIPPGLVVDHWKARGCTSRACVKREHLRLLTHRANASLATILPFPGLPTEQPVAKTGTVVPMHVAERATVRYVVDPESECHISTYSRNPNTGYAQIQWMTGGRKAPKKGGVGAHRAAYVHYSGEQIPPGMTVDHWQARGCTSRACVKREHLRLLTHFENSARQGGRDWPLGECANGHDRKFTIRHGDQSECGLCRRERALRDNHRRAGARAEWQRRRRAAVKLAKAEAKIEEKVS